MENENLYKDTNTSEGGGSGGGENDFGDKVPNTQQHKNTNVTERDESQEDATTTTCRVNNQTADGQDENDEGGEEVGAEQHKIPPEGDDEDNETKSLLAKQQPAGVDTTKIIKTPTSEGNDENDEESTLIATAFEAPYTANLAPFDMELMERLKRERERESKRHSRSLEHMRRETRSPQCRTINAAVATRMFMEHETRGPEADAGSQRREQHQSSGYGERLTADQLNKSSGGDSDQQSATMAYTDESFQRDSTSSTLLLDEDPRQSGRILNNHTNHNNYLNSHNRSKTPAIEEVPMTPLAPFKETPQEELNAPTDFYLKCERNPSLFFDDGVRSIDFVLAYKINPQQNVEEMHEKKRQKFESNLMSVGLEIEKVCKEREQIYFVKIHAPLDVLRRYAGILRLRMPMKEIPGLSAVNNSTIRMWYKLKRVIRFFMNYIYVDERYFPRRTQPFTAIYSCDKEYLFDIQQDNFFTPAIRSRIVQFILDRQRFGSSEGNEVEITFGIDRLVASNTYCAAYPLHDGEVTEKNTMRHTLYTHWASIRKWYRYQPLDYIKEYFGVKIGLYFAWLGFYTYMLLLASVVGLVCFTYSLSTLKHFEPAKELCNTQRNLTMCPLCEWCDFWDLKETCFYAKISYLIDNPSTVFFAVFMSFWATLFLELWKRYSAEITHRWDLTGFDVHEEHPRPEYMAKLKRQPVTKDFVTDMEVPVAPFWRMRLPAAVFSFSVVLLLVSLTFVAVLAVVVYRMSTMATLTTLPNPMNTSRAIVVATSSAAFLNLCFLYVLNYAYNRLAEYLTELEMWRTQTQFDDSLTLKMYLLQFVNYYASIFYVAFYKGKFIGRPGAYSYWFNYRQEECSSGGCLTELCIQLAIIMIGKQAFNTILEVIMPSIWRKIGAIRVGLSKLFYPKEYEKHKDTERWVRDLKLLDWGPRSLFPEYLEMVLQYGFVTIFVSAFPLAPFFALLNNILEMRLDAKKLLTHHRRPVSQRVRDIGVWYRILDSIGKLSVITNGFIIAFTSELIPQWVYRYYENDDGSLKGYMDFTLSSFNTSEYDLTRSLAAKYPNMTTCLYTDFREPPTSKNRYKLSNTFYIILACRLCFVVLFENFVALVMIIVRWCIPDMSVELRDQIRREAYVTNEIIIDHETQRAREERAKRSSSVRLADTDQTDDPNDSFIRIEQLLSKDLSQSQMDLIIHGSNAETGIHGDV
ncbi:anoctamin-5 isoform X2 [Stomoxys calcitrans]|uniref:Anoctamin n=1 Tax=Stomoxys calcitrans TaxID=35570 RepID=A0A1I8PNE8_STOCA|nr:anoctamin-5 isoform X2 [Stomoxys calcitrans]